MSYCVVRVGGALAAAALTWGLLAALSSGSTLVLPSFDPVIDPATALETIAAERVTVFEGAPSMYVALLDAAHHNDQDFSSLRVCVSSSEKLRAAVLSTISPSLISAKPR